MYEVRCLCGLLCPRLMQFSVYRCDWHVVHVYSYSQMNYSTCNETHPLLMPSFIVDWPTYVHCMYDNRIFWIFSRCDYNGWQILKSYNNIVSINRSWGTTIFILVYVRNARNDFDSFEWLNVSFMNVSTDFCHVCPCLKYTKNPVVPSHLLWRISRSPQNYRGHYSDKQYTDTFATVNIERFLQYEIDHNHIKLY